MDLDELSIRASSPLRRAGLSDVPKSVLAGVCIVSIALIMFAAWQFWPRQSESFALSQSASKSTAASQSNNDEENAESILIDIEGAVGAPGLYELKADARIGDAVLAAGGFTSDAAQGGVNLAQKLSDGEQVIVPTVSQEQSASSEGAGNSAGIASSGTSTGKVNINTAGAAELQTLSGIGPSLSERIIEYRRQNGKFSRIEDLQKVSGIGETRFATLKDKICV